MKVTYFVCLWKKKNKKNV